MFVSTFSTCSTSPQPCRWHAGRGRSPVRQNGFYWCCCSRRRCAVAYVSEAFVGAIGPLTEEYGISELFVGVILVPIVGNIAEHVVGKADRHKNDMDFSMGISLGSSIQVALLVTPILVFLGPLLGHPLHLIFTPWNSAPSGPPWS